MWNEWNIHVLELFSQKRCDKAAQTKNFDVWYFVDLRMISAVDCIHFFCATPARHTYSVVTHTSRHWRVSTLYVIGMRAPCALLTERMKLMHIQSLKCTPPPLDTLIALTCHESDCSLFSKNISNIHNIWFIIGLGPVLFCQLKLYLCSYYFS